MLQIKNIFQLNSLKKARLLAARDFEDNRIKKVNIMDAPDINEWVSEDELVLTSGFAIYKNIENIDEMIKGLAESKCSGLGIKLNRFFNQIPSSLIKLGNKFGLPIIEIPKNSNLGDIVEEILLEISIKYELDEINIVPMLNKCLQSENISEVIILIGRILKKNIYLKSNFFEEPLKYLFDLKEEEWKKLYNLEASYLESSNNTSYNIFKFKNNMSDYKYKLEFKIKQNDYNLADLIILTKKAELDTKKQMAVINFSLNVLLFLLNKRRILLESDHDLENKVIYNLIKKTNENKNKIIEQLDIIGINIDPNKAYFQVIVIDIPELKNNKKDNSAEYFEKTIDKLKNEIKLKNNIKTVVGLYKKNIIIIFMNNNDTQTKNKLNSLIDLINNIKKNYFFEKDFFVGISKSKDEFINIESLYLEALKALDIAKERKDNIFKYRDIGVLGDIYDLDKNQSLKKIAEENLASILNHENCEEYIQTLEKFFQSNEKSQKAAAELKIHRNTLKYRLDKIEELTGKRINNLEDKFKLYLGIKAYNLLK